MGESPYMATGRLTGLSLRERIRARAVTALGCVALAALLAGAFAGRHMLESFLPPQDLNLEVWVLPPEYTGIAPLALSSPTPAGLGVLSMPQRRSSQADLRVPEGSLVTAHVAGSNSVAGLALEFEGRRLRFVPEKGRKDGGEARAVLRHGGRLTIKKGLWTLASWPVGTIPDKPPQVKFSEPPALVFPRSLRLVIEAEDDYGVESLALRVTPLQILQNVRSVPIELELASPRAKSTRRVVYEDIASLPWVDGDVELNLVAVDSAGHRIVSESVIYTLPIGLFKHPLAKAVAEARRHLILTPNDQNARNGAANIMAGIAIRPESIGGDPLVLMGLRAGAVRVVLDRDHSATESVIDLMWPLAVRIEEGAFGSAEKAQRQAQKDLADALDRKASMADINRLTDRLREALTQYLRDLGPRIAVRPGPTKELSSLVSQEQDWEVPELLEARRARHLLDELERRAHDTSGRRNDRDDLKRMLRNP